MKAYTYEEDPWHAHHYPVEGIWLTVTNPAGRYDPSSPYLHLRPHPTLEPHPSSSSGIYHIKSDNTNPPHIERKKWGGSEIPVLIECGITERTIDSRIERALVTERPGDARALLHIKWTNSVLQPYFNEGFPQIVVMIGPTEAVQNGYSGDQNFYSYLLIFKPGDAIVTASTESKEGYINRWDGIQFRRWTKEEYFSQVVRPWMASASRSAVASMAQQAKYPLLRQCLEGGPPPPSPWKEL